MRVLSPGFETSNCVVTSSQGWLPVVSLLPVSDSFSSRQRSAVIECAQWDITMHAKALPQFTILKAVFRIRVTAFVGSFSSMQYATNGIAYLLIPPDKFIKGKISDLQVEKSRAIFTLIDSAARKMLQRGASYTYFDGYWGYRAQLVLDRSRILQRAPFRPSDTQRRKWDGTLEVVKGGWDHEHCEICLERISEDENPFGYVDQNDKWICETCYEKYVVPGSLGFIPM